MNVKYFTSISQLALQQSSDISAEIRSLLYLKLSKHRSRQTQAAKTGQSKLVRYKNKDD